MKLFPGVSVVNDPWLANWSYGFGTMILIGDLEL